MPRRKNQSPNATILGRDSTDNMSQNSDVQLHDLQSMFSGSIDPEVVQLVLSESNNGRYLRVLLIFYYHVKFAIGILIFFNPQVKI